MNSLEIITKNAKETQRVGRILAEEIIKSGLKNKQALVVGLEGELGSGKTTFIQGLAKGLGIKEAITSPTFVIMKKFQIPRNVIARSKGDPSLRSGQAPQSRRVATGLPRSFQSLTMTSFYHIDCYRINRPQEIIDLDFKEILNHSQNIIVIEWAERVRKILPSDTWWIKFEHFGQNQRRIVIYENASSY